MSDNINNQQNSEEVDLGQLFQAIGKMFKRLFDFIGSIFYGIFLGFVWFVFFLKKNIIILVIALIIGLIVGFVKSNYSDPIYQSTALIKQNYLTGENLYSTSDYFNELIAENDSITLGEALDFSSSDAAKIVGFEVTTDFNDNDKLILYNEYLTEIDTSLSDAIEFKTYVENLSDHEYEYQKVSIKFSKRGLFNKTLEKLIEHIQSSKYFKDLQKRDFAELDRSIEMLQQALVQSDSLQKVYQKVLQINPELRDNQTSITIENKEEKESTTKEYQLYLNDLKLRRELVRIEREKEDLTNIIDIISINQNSGIRYSRQTLLGIGLNTKFYYSIIFGFITLVILLGLAFLKYLERYKDKI